MVYLRNKAMHVWNFYTVAFGRKREKYLYVFKRPFYEITKGLFVSPLGGDGQPGPKPLH
jgi:hypothetical protein